MDKDVILEQIKAVAETGRTNMFDANEAQQIAYEMDFYELVNFIEEHREAYGRLIITGEIEESE